MKILNSFWSMVNILKNGYLMQSLRSFQFWGLIMFCMAGFVNANGTTAFNNPAMNPCIQRPHLAGCGANGSGQQPVKVINIPSRYGAIALDGNKLVLGSSENNLKSIRAAKKEAVQECISLGGSKTSCKVILSTRNGCIALALGAKGARGVSLAAAKMIQKDAENEALQGCRDAGGEKCYLAYSQCSRDPRYRVGK